MSREKDSHFEDYQVRYTWSFPIGLAIACLLVTLFAGAEVQLNIESDQHQWERAQRLRQQGVKPDIPGRWRIFYLVAGTASATIVGIGILSIGHGVYSHAELRERALNNLHAGLNRPNDDLKNIGITLMLQNMEQNSLLRDIKNKK